MSGRWTGDNSKGMKNVTVFGAARSGVAAANFLAARGTTVTITDVARGEDLPLSGELHPDVLQRFGSHPADVIEGIDAIVLSPGIPRSIEILREAEGRGIPIISEIELAFRNLKGRVVGITGSNGKSTTTALVGEILAAAGRDPVVAGNIGDPLIANIGDEERDYVVELSSFQLESVDTFRANVAVLLNITPDHMERYGTLDDYVSAKRRVFSNQRPGDTAIINADDPLAATSLSEGRVWRFSATSEQEPGAWFDGVDLVMTTGAAESRIARSSLRIRGKVNVENALAAWLVARALGIDDEHVRSAFASFDGLPHRMALVSERNGVTWINDSKGTNVDATLKALEGMPDGVVLLILGGKDKNGEFNRLREVVARKARLVLTIGSASEKIEAALRGSSEIVACDRMDRAVAVAGERAREGDVVLLSPACASFDQYGGFEERGRDFERLVGERVNVRTET